MPFVISTYNEKKGNDKVTYLAENSDWRNAVASDPNFTKEHIYAAFENVTITDNSGSFNEKVYHLALEGVLGDPLDVNTNLSIAIQTKAVADLQTTNVEFTDTLALALDPYQEKGDYDPKMAFLFAKLLYEIQSTNNAANDQETLKKFIDDGFLADNLSAAARSSQIKLRDEIEQKVNEYLAKKFPDEDGDEDEDTAVANALDAFENEGAEVSEIAQNSENSTNKTEIKEEDALNYKQCMLMLDFLKRAAQSPLQIRSEKVRDQTIWGKTLQTEYNSTSHNKRIIPLWCDQPDVFLNACNFNPKFKRYFSRKSTSDDSEYVSSLFYVESISDKFGKIEGINEIELNTKDEDCTLDTINIEYKGTTPATARKDVKITMTWSIKNFNFLKKDISFGKTNFKFYELITVPYGVTKGSTVGGSSLKSQYSPDYSRIRLKIKSRSNIKEYLLDGRRIQRDSEGNVIYLKEEKEIIDDYYIDLAITNHKMERDDKNHKVKVTIDYRGYFENMLSMPFMDALVSRKNLQARFERDRKLNELSDDCDPITFREIVRLNRIGDSGEVKSSNFQDKLVALGSFFNYTTDTNMIVEFVKNGEAKLDIEQDYITLGGPAGADFNKTNEDFDVNDSVTSGIKQATLGIDPEKTIKSTLSSTFCRLGDIMEAALSQLYESGTDVLLDEFEHLNLKFVFAPITFINPFEPSRLITFNPLEMPIDYQFFDQWYNSNVVNKKLTYYPVLTFIRDLTERVINGILFEACLSSRLPDEKPPMLRSGFFYSNRPSGELYQYERKGYYLDLDAYIDSRGASEKIFQYKKDNGVAGITEQPVTNYCVIYPMNSNFFNLKGGTPMKNSKWIPTFRSGTRWTDGFMSGLTFTQKNQKSGLREAKFFNTGNGLQVLSNVYDFSFTLDNVKPNNMLFPGQLIWFELWDFDNADIDPNTLNTLANVLTMGGYYMIKSVTHTFDVQKGKFTIKYDTLWTGSDTNVKFRRAVVGDKSIEENEACRSAYTEALNRARTVDRTLKSTITSIEEIDSVALPQDDQAAEKILREGLNNDLYDYRDPENRKAFEGRVNAYLQRSGNIYKQGTEFNFTGKSESNQSATVTVLTAASKDTKGVGRIKIEYADRQGARNYRGLTGEFTVNTKTGNMLKEN